MQVTTVSATIKYSLDTGHGWKAVELGAEATLDPNETWQTAQRELYGELTQQLHTMWANGKTAQNGSKSAAQPTNESEPIPASEKSEHWCEEHQAEYKRHERLGKFWYSHRAPDGKWN